MPNQAITGKHDGDDTQAINDLMKWTDRDMNGAINLNEYIFIRKAASAWRQCVSSSLLN